MARFLIDDDRPTGYCGNLCQSQVGTAPRARAIDGQRRIDDRGFVGQARVKLGKKSGNQKESIILQAVSQ
jgi:hypothetical protein